MALIGSLNDISTQLVSHPNFKEAFEYLERVIDSSSEEHKRIMNYEADAFVKIPLNESLFALEQVYLSKERKECFFESHRQYIDVQFIVDGEERIDIASINDLGIEMPYDIEKDFMKYSDQNGLSSLLLKKGDVAIFFPEDAHMPCLKTEKKTMVYKTVVKVPV